MFQKTMIKKLGLLLAAVMLAGMLFACNAGQTETNAGHTENGANADGGQEMTNINAKELLIVPTEKGATVTLRFVLGSEMQNVDEAKAEGVPFYRVTQLPSPARLVLEFDSIDYWDYDRMLEVSDDDPLFHGIFKHIQRNEDDNRFRIVFQLSKNADAVVTDKDDTITIDFTIADEQDESEHFFVMTTAIQPFSIGQLNSGNLFVALSSDYSNQVLISAPYDNEADAKAAMVTAISENNGYLDEKNTFVIALEGNNLPAYAQSEDLKIVYSQSIMRRNGLDETLPVIMPDGIYLCATDNNALFLFAKQLYSENDNSAQELWTMDGNGKIRRLMEIEFASIETASFSPDGKKLAILERTTETSYLYIYDMETRQLDNLGEEHLGNTTSAFIWDTLGTAIYAISGNDRQQLLKYDFTMPEDNMRVSAVEENEIGEGDLGFYNGEIYFTNVTDDDRELVYRIKPEGGLRTEFAQGGSFRIAPDGQYMAILRSVSHASSGSSSDDEAQNGESDDLLIVSLILKNMVTGEEQSVSDNSVVLSYDWATDGKLYFIESSIEGFTEEYSYRLMCFDTVAKQLAEIAELKTSQFLVTPDPNVIYIPLIDPGEEDGIAINATYRFKLDTPLPAAQSEAETEGAATADATPGA